MREKGNATNIIIILKGDSTAFTIPRLLLFFKFLHWSPQTHRAFNPPQPTSTTVHCHLRPCMAHPIRQHSPRAREAGEGRGHGEVARRSGWQRGTIPRDEVSRGHSLPSGICPLCECERTLLSIGGGCRDISVEVFQFSRSAQIIQAGSPSELVAPLQRPELTDTCRTLRFVVLLPLCEDPFLVCCLGIVCLEGVSHTRVEVQHGPLDLGPWTWRLELHPPDGLVFRCNVFDEEEGGAFLEVGIVMSPFVRITFQSCSSSLFGCEEMRES